MYVLDTNVISSMHRNYYRNRFVSLWKQFDQLVADRMITSTREAYHELHNGYLVLIRNGPWQTPSSSPPPMRRKLRWLLRFTRWRTSRPI